MRQLQPVIWSKGTFLSPQHLQAQERFVEDSARFYLDSLNARSWGFREIQIDTKALSGQAGNHSRLWNLSRCHAAGHSSLGVPAAGATAR